MKNIITNCLIKTRDGETLFTETEDGNSFYVTIDGYAIIPIEDYDKLAAIPPKGFLAWVKGIFTR